MYSQMGETYNTSKLAVCNITLDFFQMYRRTLFIWAPINPLRPKSHYSGFVTTGYYKNYNSRVLWAMNLG